MIDKAAGKDARRRFRTLVKKVVIYLFAVLLFFWLVAPFGWLVVLRLMNQAELFASLLTRNIDSQTITLLLGMFGANYGVPSAELAASSVIAVIPHWF